MTRDQLLVQLAVARQVFDDKVGLVPPESLKVAIPGFGRSVAQLVAHISAHDRLVVTRIASAERAGMAQLQADDDPERYERSTWTFADKWPVNQVLRRGKANFQALVERVRNLSDDELNERIGVGGALNPSWLRGRPPWQAILEDTVGHYQEHEAMLDQARQMTVSAR